MPYQQESLAYLKLVTADRPKTAGGASGWATISGSIRFRTIEALERMGLIETRKRTVMVKVGCGLFGRNGIRRIPQCEVIARQTDAGRECVNG